MIPGDGPVKGKVTLLYFWSCLACDEKGEGPDSNKQAEKHQAKDKHSTRAWAVPAP